MKRFISLIMVFVLSVTFCTTALAAETKNVSSALVEDSFETVTEESDNSQEWYYGDNLDSDDIQTAINQDIPETAAAVNDDVTYVTYEPPKTLEFSGVFNRPNEKHTYKIEIDHSLYPDINLYGFLPDKLGSVDIHLYDEAGKEVEKIFLRTRSGSSVDFPKYYKTINNTTGGIVTYTLEVSSTTGNVDYIVKIGTPNNFIKDFGGKNNISVVEKNYPYNEESESLCIANYIYGYTSLLNEGEWYKYTADGETYISAEIHNNKGLRFDIYDAKTGSLIYQSTGADVKEITKKIPATYYALQKKIDTTARKEYLIRFYSSTSYTNPTDEKYCIFIGLPYVLLKKMSVSSKTTFSLPARTRKTFTFNVSSFPKSARTDKLTKVTFLPSVYDDRDYITDFEIEAPNGNVFYGKNGTFSDFPQTTLESYLDNPKNTPLNGTWRVTIRSSKAISGLTFKISGLVNILAGDEI